MMEIISGTKKAEQKFEHAGRVNRWCDSANPDLLAHGGLQFAAVLQPANGAEPIVPSRRPTGSPSPQAQQPRRTPRRRRRLRGANGAAGKLVVTVGKSLIIDSPLDIQRLSVANGDLAEAVAVNPKEVLINGKAAGRDLADRLAAERRAADLRPHGPHEQSSSWTRRGSRSRAISRAKTST